MIKLLAEKWGRAEADILLDGFRKGFRSLMQDFEIFIRHDQPELLPYESLAHAIRLNWNELACRSRIARGRLREIQSGAEPTELERVRIALVLGFSEEILERLEEASTTKKHPD